MIAPAAVSYDPTMARHADTAADIFVEPYPCEHCRNSSYCSRAGAACHAFSAYVHGRRWYESMTPDRVVGERLGLVAAGAANDGGE